MNWGRQEGILGGLGRDGWSRAEWDRVWWSRSEWVGSGEEGRSVAVLGWQGEARGGAGQQGRVRWDGVGAVEHGFQHGPGSWELLNTRCAFSPRSWCRTSTWSTAGRRSDSSTTRSSSWTVRSTSHSQTGAEAGWSDQPHTEAEAGWSTQPHTHRQALRQGGLLNLTLTDRR